MLANKYTRYLLLASFVIFAGGLSAYLIQNPPFQKESEATCQGTARKIHFTLRPDFYLNKKFLPPGSLSETDLSKYVDRHLRFLATTVQNFDSKSAPKFAAIPANGYKVTKISSENAKYPLTLSIWKSNEFLLSFTKRLQEHPDIDSAYMAQALEVGATSITDEALHISYETEVTMYACETADQKMIDQVSLPVDPFLALWFVPENKNVVKFHELFTRDFKITPCANSEFMNDYDPYYYWYYWSLSEKDCRTALTESSFKEFPLIEKTELSLKPEKHFDLRFLDDVKSRRLKVTANFTMIDDDSLIVPDPFDALLDTRIPEIVGTDKFSKVRSDLDKLQNYDIALRTGLVFAWSMRKISDDFKLEQWSRDTMLLQWLLTGKLKESQQPYEIVVTIGSAMADASSYKSFYEALNKGLATSDIVFYGGHSGVGKNLSVNRLQDGVQNLFGSLPSGSIPQHQLLMLMTCYSLHYFSPQNFPLPKQKAFVRDILQTASLPVGYDARMLTGLMVQVDNYLESGRHLPYEKWPKKFKGDLFLVHQQQTN